MDKKPLLVLSALAGGIVTSSLALAEESGNAAYKLVECNGVWQLLRAGEPFCVKGAVGWESYDLLRRCGANSVRTGRTKRVWTASTRQA